METSPDMSASMSQQRLVTDVSARELAPLLTTDERALVSMLATAEMYRFELKDLIDGYAEETGSVAASEYSGLLNNCSHPLDAATQVRGLFSQPTMAALNSARASGTLKSFYRSWLSQTVEDRVNRVRHEDTHIAAFARLGLRSLFCVFWIGFILMFILPEFKKMNEEFGIESSSPMAMLVDAGGLAFQILPFLLLSIVFLLLYIVIFKRTILTNYIQRWLPGRWQQVILPKSILKRKMMAWDLQGFQKDDQKTTDSNFDWDFYVSKRLLTSAEARIMRSTDSLETQSWLLRNMSDKRLQKRNDRFEVLVRCIIISFQIVIAVFIILAALAIFSTLLEIMRGLG